MNSFFEAKKVTSWALKEYKFVSASSAMLLALIFVGSYVGQYNIPLIANLASLVPLGVIAFGIALFCSIVLGTGLLMRLIVPEYIAILLPDRFISTPGKTIFYSFLNWFIMLFVPVVAFFFMVKYSAWYGVDDSDSVVLFLGFTLVWSAIVSVWHQKSQVWHCYNIFLAIMVNIFMWTMFYLILEHGVNIADRTSLGLSVLFYSALNYLTTAVFSRREDFVYPLALAILVTAIFGVFSMAFVEVRSWIGSATLRMTSLGGNIPIQLIATEESTTKYPSVIFTCGRQGLCELEEAFLIYQNPEVYYVSIPKHKFDVVEIWKSDTIFISKSDVN